MELGIGLLLGALLFGCKDSVKKKRSKEGQMYGCLYCTSDTAPDCPYHPVNE